MEGRYADFNISRKQAQQIYFTILADIEAYVEANPEQYEQFLLAEEKKGGRKNDEKNIDGTLQ